MRLVQISACAFLLGLLSLVISSSAVAADASAKPTTIEYNRDVHPILAENCFRCHGPDSASRKAELRLDRREVAIEKEAIKPGKPEESELVSRIRSTDPEEMMPPPAIHKELTAKQKEILAQWIAAGAEYQPHWSLIAPTRPALPEVKDKAWARNPVDVFVLSALEQRGLTPAAEADRPTLARRASLDITGLPPTPAQVEEFVNDTNPEAYEHYVDRLLASKQWGEHRARYWLDLARYADTHGIHFDNYREIWSFRDWVINAYNQNMPFDQFTIEQLAGDLLPNATLSQQVASGFNRCNITTSEGGAIDAEYIVLYARDRTETTSLVWLGLTAGCAVCHDHKFDPLTQKEFYSLTAFFNNTTQPAMDGNIKDTPPTMRVPMVEDQPRWNQLITLVDNVKQKVQACEEESRPQYETWLAAENSERPDTKIPTEGLTMRAALSEGSGDDVKVEINGEPRDVKSKSKLDWATGYVANQALKVSKGDPLELEDAGDFDTAQAFSYGAWLRLPNVNKRGQTIDGVVLARMDEGDNYRGWDLRIEGGRVTAHIVHKWSEDAIKVITVNRLPKNQWNHLFITYDGSSKAAGMHIYINGVRQETTVDVDGLKGTIRTKVPLSFAQRHTTDRLNGAQIQDARVYSRALTDAEVDRLTKGTRAGWLMSKPIDKRTAPERTDLFNWWLSAFDQQWQDTNAQLDKLKQEQITLQQRSTVAHVMHDNAKMMAKAHILFRGEYDKERDEVHPATPAFLPPMAEDLPKNRLGLAQWLLRPEHPLTARVTVNRAWQELFGAGIVRTPGDFGVTGDIPTHPELLDWMAIELREQGWDLKRFYRMLVTSAAYRQSSVTTPEKLEKDPANTYLSRGPRFRMDAEMIRDYALASSGLLVSKIGGPSVKPYQPAGIWEISMEGSNTRNYVPDRGEGLYRRSMYTFWKRAAPPASMDIFNAPTREGCTVRRDRTDTPLQALVTLNDPQFVEAARKLAESAIQASPDTQARIDFLARRLLARPFRADESPLVEQSVNELTDYYQAHADDAGKLLKVGESPVDKSIEPAQLAAWTMLTNELLNLDEVLNK